MDDSILDTVKEQLGIDRDNHDFDRDLILTINSVFFILYQEGLTDGVFEIRDNTKKWDELLLNSEKPLALNSIIRWVALRTRLLFDPPASSIMMDALEQSIAELEWRGFITNNYVGEIEGLYGE